ncbi:MAG: DUF418 domain-containing protein [Lysobacteraceae bacterium]
MLRPPCRDVELIAPIPERERVELIDALRGFALLGVLFVNLHSLSLFGLLPKAEREALPTAGVDHWLGWFSDTFVSGTSITLFSLLFGMGFAMQMQRGDSGIGTRIYVRRLLLLLLIGLLHAALWWGDILRYYAALGLLLIPLSRLSSKWLATLGALTVIVLPLWLQTFLPGLLPKQIISSESAALSLSAFSGNDWGAVFDANLARDLRMRIAVWVLPTYVLGRLMIGAALGRSGVLQQAAQHHHLWQRSFVVMSLLSVAILLALAFRPAADAWIALPWLDGQNGRWLTSLLRNAAPLCLGLAYLGGFVLLYLAPASRRFLRWLAPVGRMALTNYLSQTLLSIAIFYGIGLGIGPRFGMLGILFATLLIFAAQAVWSVRWLERHQQGPMEALWRRLTYGRRSSVVDRTSSA